MKPIIGITPEIAEDGKISLNYAYTHAIEQAGGIPYVLPCTEDETLLDELVALCHGFCFSGGEDIEPARYGEEKLPQCGAQALRRDAFDFRLFEKALASGKAHPRHLPGRSADQCGPGRHALAGSAQPAAFGTEPCAERGRF